MFAAAVGVGCGLSPTGENATFGEDGGDDTSSASSSSGAGGSSGSEGGASSGSGGSDGGSSSGGPKDARADGKPSADGSSGGKDAPDDTTMGDDSPADAPPDMTSSEAGCSGPSDCPPGYACEPDGTCNTVCSTSTPCNQGCCDNTVNGRCWQTSNTTCNSGGLCTACTCGMAGDCPQYWACGPTGKCSENCDAMHLCNDGCCSDIDMGECVGTDCSGQLEGPVCNNQGFCGCNTNNDCNNSGYGPDCMGMPGGAGNGCQCHENGNSGTGDCAGACIVCAGSMPTRCHC